MTGFVQIDSLNVTKTDFLLFSNNSNKSKNAAFTLPLSNKILHKSHYVKYLSILVDNKLNWKSHLNKLTKTVSRAIGLLRPGSNVAFYMCRIQLVN